MRIGILGSGNMGAALGHLFATAGHDVTFSYSRDPAKLERLARQNGPHARAGTPSDAVQGANAVLLAVHWIRVPQVLRAAGSLRGKILIDCTLPMTASDERLAVGHRSRVETRRPARPGSTRGEGVQHDSGRSYCGPAPECYPSSRWSATAVTMLQPRGSSPA